ncbi:MAG: killer suppression protein [Nitrospirae bacterium]|nr:killer suppression protein [Nitrospirota bacterium]
MLLSFHTRKLEKECNDQKALIRSYGPEQAKLIARRLAELEAADNLEVMRTLPQVRAHELKGNRAGQVSLDVKHPYRLLITADYDDPPCKPDGGLDWQKITKVKIRGVVDTHE